MLKEGCGQCAPCSPLGWRRVKFTAVDGIMGGKQCHFYLAICWLPEATFVFVGRRGNLYYLVLPGCFSWGVVVLCYSYTVILSGWGLLTCPYYVILHGLLMFIGDYELLLRILSISQPVWWDGIVVFFMAQWGLGQECKANRITHLIMDSAWPSHWWVTNFDVYQFTLLVSVCCWTELGC